MQAEARYSIEHGDEFGRKLNLKGIEYQLDARILVVGR